MNHVVLILYFSNSFKSLRTPTVPAKYPFSIQCRCPPKIVTKLITNRVRYRLWNLVPHMSQATLCHVNTVDRGICYLFSNQLRHQYQRIYSIELLYASAGDGPEPCILSFLLFFGMIIRIKILLEKVRIKSQYSGTQYLDPEYTEGCFRCYLTIIHTSQWPRPHLRGSLRGRN